MYIMSKKCIESILRDENEAQYKVKLAFLALLILGWLDAREPKKASFTLYWASFSSHRMLSMHFLDMM